MNYHDYTHNLLREKESEDRLWRSLLRRVGVGVLILGAIGGVVCWMI